MTRIHLALITSLSLPIIACDSAPDESSGKAGAGENPVAGPDGDRGEDDEVDTDDAGETGEMDDEGETGETGEDPATPNPAPVDGPEVFDEPCDFEGEVRSCADRDDGAEQFCAEFAGETMWGPCVEVPECYPLEDVCSICDLEAGVPRYGGEADCGSDTPLVLSFDGREPRFDAATTDSFDLAADGSCMNTDWPTADTPWLALDRDGNGLIDGGHELFGSGTSLASGVRADQGFQALAELDTNGDGKVSAADERFGDLLLWSDHDGDRRSSLTELEALASRGVTSLAVEHELRARCDARGNCGVERAAFEFASDTGAAIGEIVDVHMMCW
jgi:hypothetical protein